MKNNDTAPYAIIGKFARIVELWSRLEKQPRKFGIDEALYRSQIHMIEVIGENDDVSVSDLAEIQGVTKGAASQNIKKLEEKELVIKVPDPANSSRLLVRLTAKGKIAYYAHEHWHETMDGGFKEYFTNLSHEKVAALDEVLTKIEAFLKKRL